MNTNTHILKLSDARDEAERLTRATRRRVEPVTADCACDYSRDCYVCGGSGTTFQLVYAFCNHVVQESDDLDCAENNCESREREARDLERPDTWPRVGKPLQSCAQVGAQEESEAA